MLRQDKISIGGIAEAMGDIQQVSNYDGNDAGNRLETLVRDIDYTELKKYPQGKKLFLEDVKDLTETLYSHPRVKLCYAMLLERLDQPKAAFDVYQEIRTTSKTYWRAYFYQAHLAMEQHQFQVARNILLEMKNLPKTNYISPSLKPNTEDKSKLDKMLAEINTKITATYTGKNKRKKEQRRAQNLTVPQQATQPVVQQLPAQPIAQQSAQQAAKKDFFGTLTSIGSAFFAAAEFLSDDLSANGRLREDQHQSLKRSR